MVPASKVELAGLAAGRGGGAGGVWAVGRLGGAGTESRARLGARLGAGVIGQREVLEWGLRVRAESGGGGWEPRGGEPGVVAGTTRPFDMRVLVLVLFAALRGGDQAGLVGEDHELRAVARAELDHRPADVRLGGRG